MRISEAHERVCRRAVPGARPLGPRRASCAWYGADAGVVRLFGAGWPGTGGANTFRPPAPLLSNLARNSPEAPSNIEFTSLELQRFLAVSKNYRLKLRAKFVWARPAIARRRRDQALPQHLGLTPATRNVL